jgi:amidohydrolase
MNGLINEILKNKANEVESYVINLRREFHEHPEVAANEEWTSRRIKEEIDKIGLPYEMVSNTGFIATLDTGREGKSVALRADIDALPMQENPENLKGKKVVVSKIDGVCHSCGHDAHASMLLGAMKILVDIKDELEGKIFFCFEEGEESGTGINGMLEALSKKKIDTVWAIHVYSALESGKISVDKGPRMAGSCGIDVTVHGKGGHGSRPDLSASPIYAAACIMNNLSAAWINQIDANETVTLGIANFHSGTEATNIIPETATFKGSMRYFNVKEGEKALNIVKEISEATAKMHKCNVKFGSRMIMSVGPTINDEECSLLAKKALSEVLPEGTVSTCSKWYASESMSRYLERYPGVFAFLGIKNDELGSGAEHHNERFDVDDSVLKIGVLSTAKYAVSFLNDK